VLLVFIMGSGGNNRGGVVPFAGRVNNSLNQNHQTSETAFEIANVKEKLTGCSPNDN